jgi:formylglycine-generating enzyme required for sulfatase activity
MLFLTIVGASIITGLVGCRKKSPAELRYTIYKEWPFDAQEAKRRQKETAESLGVPVEKTIDLGNGVKMDFILIPPGEFMMGSPADEQYRYIDEEPQHRVRITKAFYMGVTEVTQKQYRVFMITALFFKGENLPQGSVGWDTAVEFCRKLSQKEGKTYRLPTEAEWEYACRAGSTTRYCFGGSDSMLSDYAWYHDNSDYKTHPVGQKKPNAFGLYDMYGNLWEWCSDWYDKNYYSKSPTDDPKGPSQRRFLSARQWHVLRGGEYDYPPWACRSANRIKCTGGPPPAKYTPSFLYGGDVTSFRVILDF